MENQAQPVQQFSYQVFPSSPAFIAFVIDTMRTLVTLVFVGGFVVAGAAGGMFMMFGAVESNRTAGIRAALAEQNNPQRDRREDRRGDAAP